jgi:hypothetical protein
VGFGEVEFRVTMSEMIFWHYPGIRKDLLFGSDWLSVTIGA